MFTGIVEETGRIRAIGAEGISIAAALVLDGLHSGDSIAVNGVCLTVTDFDKNSFQADVMPETVRCTALSALRRGNLVNLERALEVSSRLGGHIVSGHVDGVGLIKGFKTEGNAVLLRVSAAAEIIKYIIPKGSVALDGISLTVVEVAADSFTVSLIPHTRANTDLQEKQPGEKINIENDIIGKYVDRFLHYGAAQKDTVGITKDLLRKYGF